ncbi:MULTISPECIES: MBL fold metallo-hydrolase [Bacillus]|uniref:MBL fold metallo-hydrolase n=1 Tax=Bacillus TaxID=1386 RepID=UPI000479723A|nr:MULTISPECIES: MBL fold metallo-hydrolase [Bacillus]QHZ48304.1 MBL fold metallo-hydrolase [Bacillus sp. NSP9.1]WFA06033.1 MBL fold metallo-hydrolase [Bacillus sp. HSf4]
MIDDSWFTVTDLGGDTFAISEDGHWEHVHSYLLLGADEAYLIDTGLGISSIKKITDKLTSLPVKVITTHVHWDHIGSHGEYDCIYVHEAEKEWLTDGIKGLPIEQIRRDVSRDITKPVPETFSPESYTPYQGEPTAVLKDGDVLGRSSRPLIIYHTPGHSPGHISVFDETTGFLFTGDLLYSGAPVYAFYPTTDPCQLVCSLEKISTLRQVKKVFGGHHQLGLAPDILKEAGRAAHHLKKHRLARHGTGIHEFKSFSVQF